MESVPDQDAPRTDGRTRRALLFSAAFIVLVVTLTGRSDSLKKSSRHHSSLYAEDSNTAEKVKVRIYMETECPPCKIFMTHYINKILANDGVRIDLLH